MNLAKYTNTHAVDLPAKQVHISEILRGNEFFCPFQSASPILPGAVFVRHIVHVGDTESRKVTQLSSSFPVSHMKISD